MPGNYSMKRIDFIPIDTTKSSN